MATNADVGGLLAMAGKLVAQGWINQAEAEGATLGALNWFAPDDAKSAQERNLAQMAPDDRQRVQSVMDELATARAAHLERARAAMLAIPDDEWQAAGGT